MTTSEQNLRDRDPFSWFRNLFHPPIAAAFALSSGLVMLAQPRADAQERIDNEIILFDVETIVEFEFLQSNGAYQSTFGVINLETGEKTPIFAEAKPSDNFQSVERPSNYQPDLTPVDDDDFIGTPGNTVPEPLAEFRFEANTPYAFYLESSYNGRPTGILYSSDNRNPSNQNLLRFEGGFPELTNGSGIYLRWDDTGAALTRPELEDRDFDDFIVIMGGYLGCPYPENGLEQ